MYSKKVAKALLDAATEYDGVCKLSADPLNRVEIFHEYFEHWDVSEFLGEYWPETVVFALENMYYDMGATRFFLLTDESEVKEEIENLREEFGDCWDDYCTVIRDAAFDGAVFIED